ncbi:hypothetical protein P170DRAFT_6678 [Aspergillus steynii IBT 23096]|uniref:Uncharacterized protein n=1 Tax=Aspergillus steynii IBT 23096 TaxID=1392250 RepID=A0A2I2GM78_9EURO|nr:uncharacterized protein P170DRAFT_6678 [Aspergillus steynii IBT 23096]PLB53960.1 hypothetical protein P170DRAFT_6678 [Aspergillus steynii IBT 23096]
MRPSQALALAFAAGLSLAPGAVAVLGTSCLSAMNTLQELPIEILKHVQEHSCAAGCKPQLGHWSKYGKQAVLEPIVEDGSKRTELPEGKEAMVDYIDAIFKSVESQCHDQIDGRAHFCDDAEKINPFMECARKEVHASSAHELPKLTKHMNEKSCKKVEEYAKSPALWDEDFPKHFQNYVEKCDEL